MAHGLEQRADGSFSYVGAREEAWHKLGITYKDVDGLSVATVLRDLQAGQIITAPVQATVFTPEGLTLVEDPSKKMTIRQRPDGSMTPLGVVGHGYTVVSEAEAFGFLDLVIDSGEAQVTSAGLLDGGKRAFCCFTLPEAVMVGGSDEVKLHALISLAHDGTMSLTGAVTPIRTVCQNTLTLGLAMAQRVWKIRHTSKMKLQVAEARKALDITFKYADAWTRAAEEMISTKITNDQFDELVATLTAPQGERDESKVTWKNYERNREVLHALYRQADTCEEGRGTAWAAYNAFTEYQDWYRPVRGADDAVAAKFQRALVEEDDLKKGAYAAIKRLVLA